eukprot:scaffold202456_cov28-Tisochrysis_lutea.AAC.1
MESLCPAWIEVQRFAPLQVVILLTMFVKINGGEKGQEPAPHERAWAPHATSQVRPSRPPIGGPLRLRKPAQRMVPQSKQRAVSWGGFPQAAHGLPCRTAESVKKSFGMRWM